ncbi:hypothetical protein PG994_008278 [Apiospora phragmitis]|uniref:Uncharacterized protein n=1 Tax=Apiospora phragmitis TaxID=2905665 RepID=A0ABR1UT96_9PEZI
MARSAGLRTSEAKTSVRVGNVGVRPRDITWPLSRTIVGILLPIHRIGIVVAPRTEVVGQRLRGSTADATVLRLREVAHLQGLLTLLADAADPSEALGQIHLVGRETVVLVGRPQRRERPHGVGNGEFLEAARGVGKARGEALGATSSMSSSATSASLSTSSASAGRGCIGLARHFALGCLGRRQAWVVEPGVQFACWCVLAGTAGVERSDVERRRETRG